MSSDSTRPWSLINGLRNMSGPDSRNRNWLHDYFKIIKISNLLIETNLEGIMRLNFKKYEKCQRIEVQKHLLNADKG